MILLRVKYNPALWVIFLIMGIVLLGISVFFLRLPSVPGLVLTLVSILYFTRHYFILYDNRLVVPTLLGPAKKTYNLKSLEDIIIEKNRVYVKIDGKLKKTGIKANFSNTTHWKEFVLFVEGHNLFK